MNRIKRYWLKKFRQPSDRSVRWFAVLLTGLLLVFIYKWAGNQNYAFFVPALIPLLGLFYLRFLRFVYAVLMIMTSPIGWLVSSVILLLVFLFVITPLAFFRKRGFPSGWQKSEQMTQASKMHE